jgi:hypothetical protein
MDPTVTTQGPPFERNGPLRSKRGLRLCTKYWASRTLSSALMLPTPLVLCRLFCPNSMRRRWPMHLKRDWSRRWGTTSRNYMISNESTADQRPRHIFQRLFKASSAHAAPTFLANQRTDVQYMICGEICGVGSVSRFFSLFIRGGKNLRARSAAQQ